MILVTGADGFLGRHVVRRMDPGRVLVRQRRESRETSLPGTEVVEGDVSDASVVARAVRGVEAVVHLASKNIDRDGTGFERINVEGTRLLCEAAREAGVRRFLYVSTVGVYGHRPHRDADEDTPVRPDTAFSRSKAAAEDIVLAHAREGSFEAAVLRHRFVYGEGDVAFVPRLMRAARRNPFLIGGGSAGMSVVWAPDFAEIVSRFLASTSMVPDCSPVFHVTDGRPVAYRDVIGTLCEVFGYRHPWFTVPYGLLYVPVRLRERLLGIDPETSASSITSLRLKLVGRDATFSNRKLLDRFPEMRFASFEQGLAQSLDFYSRGS